MSKLTVMPRELRLNFERGKVCVKTKQQQEGPGIVALRRGGRPRLNDDARKELLRVYVSPKELADLEEQADRARVPAGAWAREVLLRGAPPQCAFPADLCQIWADLSQMLDQVNPVVAMLTDLKVGARDSEELKMAIDQAVQLVAGHCQPLRSAMLKLTSRFGDVK
jgi:hypothetical protein